MVKSGLIEFNESIAIGLKRPGFNPLNLQFLANFPNFFLSHKHSQFLESTKPQMPCIWEKTPCSCIDIKEKKSLRATANSLGPLCWPRTLTHIAIPSALSPHLISIYRLCGYHVGSLLPLLQPSESHATDQNLPVLVSQRKLWCQLDLLLDGGFPVKFRSGFKLP